MVHEIYSRVEKNVQYGHIEHIFTKYFENKKIYFLIDLFEC